jgi:L-lysine 2,3-aminomutase/ferredoxin
MKYYSGISKKLIKVAGYKANNRIFESFGDWSRHYSSDTSDVVRSFSRVEELRKKLKEESGAPILRSLHVFEISQRGKDFLQEVSANLNRKYSRGGKSGEGYVGIEELIKVAEYYDEDEKKRLLDSSSSLQDRMRIKVSKSYLDHMLKVPENSIGPNPALKIVMPDSREIQDLDGETDPSNQNRYSPMPGLLHKYEMLLTLVSVNCSSHCRYCYRLDLFNGTSGKSKADMSVIAAYIKTFNDLIDDAIKNHGRRDKEAGLWLHKETGEPLIHAREILFSGGDPMTLPNATLARYISMMAEAGINEIRIGTKELAFNPSRFDSNFWEMMDRFHETYPEIKVDIVGHYSHPFELVEAKVDRSGQYVYDINLNYRTRKDLRDPLLEINKRHEWIGHHNQFPIIAGVNDSTDVLRLLIYQSQRLGIEMHNIYACREIVGNKHFRSENTIESQYELLERAKSGLSGLKNHVRLVMSTEYGKMEVLIVNDGSVMLGLNRFVHGRKPDNTIIEVDLEKLPNGQKFYWLTDDIIDSAVSDSGKKVLMELRDEDNSLIKRFKKTAASIVLNKLPQNDNEEPKHNSSDQKVTIEVVNRNGGSKIIHVDLADKIYERKSPTLATILADKQEIEAACKEQLSCSTCVGEVKSNVSIPEASDDERDVLDSVTMDPSRSIRATCQIHLESGSYKFRSLETIADEKNNQETKKGGNQR